MKEFFVFVGDIWGDLSPKRRISIALVAVILIVYIIF
jgi:hypothetical protein